MITASVRSGELAVYVVGRRDLPIQAARGPLLVLKADDWNDYGFVTLHFVIYYDDAGAEHELGAIKVLRRGLNSGRALAVEGEVRLDAKYCSLGQSLEYYETVASLGSETALRILRTLRDVVIKPSRLARFVNEPAFEKSLLRSPAAESALRLGPAIFETTHKVRQSEDRSFLFTAPVGETTLVLNFSLGQGPGRPRLMALIGTNGTGKTKILSALGRALVTPFEDRGTPTSIRNNGVLHPPRTQFTRVIMISHSPFDEFALPRAVLADYSDSPDTPEDESKSDESKSAEQILGYSYCGLRDPQQPSMAVLRGPESYKLDFVDALADIRRDPKKFELLAQMFAQLRLETSIARQNLLAATAADDLDTVRATYSEMSSGHKILFRSVAHLARALTRNSLAIFDEPETHLHPPLLAAFLSSIAVALEARDSFGIVGTHSPVVLQEMFAHQVIVLERFGNHTQIRRPDIQTLGENVGLITQHVFNLPQERRAYTDQLSDLSEGEIAALEPPLGYKAERVARGRKPS